MDALAHLIADPAAWLALATLIVMEVVLGIDNLVFVSILTNKLPEAMRARARRLGIGLALGLRLALLAALSWIVGLTAPVISLPFSPAPDAQGHVPFDLNFSWRDLILISGGLFLVWKATTEIHHTVDPHPAPDVFSPKQQMGANFAAAIVQILALDLVFSIDSILTAVGMTDHLPIMAAAVVVAVGLMLWASGPLAAFIHRNPSVVMLALGFLLMIGMVLIADGFGVHVPKGYIYAAMAFSAFVEGLNMTARRRAKAVPHDPPITWSRSGLDSASKALSSRRPRPARRDNPKEAPVTAVEPVRQTFTPEERRITIAGVLLVFLLSALDQTIVSTAMPKIVSQLQGLNLYAWVTTAYMLSSTVMVPIYGKLGDIYGRKAILITGIGLFLAGSMLCGLSGEFGRLPVLGGGMTQLIVFRGLQGLGGGALFTSAFAIIGDLFPPRERGKFAGLFGAVFGLASILGPVIGGFFTDLGVTHLLGYGIAGWRWVFYVNLPVSAVSLFMIISKMPTFTHRNPGKIDFAGAILIAVTVIPLLLALSWGGRDYGWASPQIIGLAALSIAGLCAFVWTESVVSNPILSLSLFKNRVFTTANAAGFVSSMAFMGSVAFLPLYMQIGQGVRATTSGLSMLPMMAGLIISSTLCGQLITRTGKYKPFMLTGSAILIVALFLIAQVGAQTTSLDLGWRMVILGLGLGPSMSTYNIAVQNAVQRSQLGVATSSTQFFRQIGGTVGVALFGAVLTHNVAAVSAKFPAPAGAPAHVMDLGDLRRMAIANASDAASASAPHVAAGLPAAAEIRTLIVQAIVGVFSVAVGIAALAFVLVLLIPVLPLEHRGPPGLPVSEG